MLIVEELLSANLSLFRLTLFLKRWISNWSNWRWNCDFFQWWRGAEKDYNKAFEFYQRAAYLGYPRAFYNIGSLYEQENELNQISIKLLNILKKPPIEYSLTLMMQSID